MGPLCLLLTAALLLAQAAPLGASQHCGRLKYWNPDNRCCGSCLQRFGPPPCPDFEFSENCGLNDSGDHVSCPFKEYPIGQCNPDSAEQCSPCGGGATAPAPAGSRSGETQWRCRERSVPPKEPCPLNTGKPSVLSSQEPSPSATSSVRWTSEHNVTQQALPNFALVLVLLVLVLLVTSAVILLLAQRCHLQAKGLHPYLGLNCRTWHRSPSRLLDELEVPEELIVLLDPEPGPGGGVACGTTRHLAARYAECLLPGPPSPTHCSPVTHHCGP